MFFYISSFICFFTLTGFCSFGIFGEVTEFSSVEKYCHIGWKVLTIFGWLGGYPTTPVTMATVLKILEKYCAKRSKHFTSAVKIPLGGGK